MICSKDYNRPRKKELAGTFGIILPNTLMKTRKLRLKGLRKGPVSHGKIRANPGHKPSFSDTTVSTALLSLHH